MEGSIPIDDVTRHVPRRWGALLALALLMVPLCAGAAQPTKVPRIGFLAMFASPLTEAFQEGLRENGYVEGQTIAVEYRWAQGKAERLPGLVAELLRLPVDVIVTAGTQATRAAKDATSTTPIVMAISSDPVGTGLVASLARPGGNVTGLSHLNVDVSGKRLELLKEAVPKISRVGVLWNAGHPAKRLEWKEAESAAKLLKLTLHSAEVRGPGDFDRAFSALVRERVDALLTFEDPLTLAHRRQIVALAAKHRLPAMYEPKEFAEAGGLIAYGPSFAALYRRAATYVARILAGARPSDLAVQQPEKFELVVNLQTARALGLTMPRHVLMQAERVLE